VKRSFKNARREGQKKRLGPWASRKVVSDGGRVLTSSEKALEGYVNVRRAKG